MRLCLFDAGHGPRLGHVRRNHVVDVAALDAAIPADKTRLMQPDADLRQRLAAVADSCPMPTMMLRRENVRILDEWDLADA